MLTRTIDLYREKTKETLVSTCRLLGVDRQVYYRRKQTLVRKQETAEIVVQMVMEVRKQMPRVGTRKLYYLLHDQLRELHVGRDKLFAILEANRMLIKPTRRYVRTTNSYHRFYKHKDLIAHLVPERPEQVWASDITYLGSNGDFKYLALVTDTYSKKIVGYDVSKSLSTDGPLRALKMGLRQRSYENEALIHHSDRGYQYCSDTYQALLKRRGVKCSMTESYDPYSNAVAERVNGILKQEFLLDNQKADLEVMKKMVKNSIQIYNHLRPHHSCYMRTPEQMHKQSKIRIRNYRKTNRTKKKLDAVS
jgi:putative transposase